MNKFFNIHNFAIENKMSRNTVMRELEMFLNEIESINPTMNRVLNNSDVDFKVVTVKEMSIRFEKGVRGCTNIHDGTATVWVCNAGKEHGCARRSIAHEFGHLVYRFILKSYPNLERAWFSLFTDAIVMLNGFCMGVMDGFSYCLTNPEEGFAEVFAAYHMPELRAKMNDNFCCELVEFIDAIMEHDYSDLLYGMEHPEEVKVEETPMTIDDLINGLESMLGMSLEDFIDGLEDE